jgi:hypothetical protein
MASFPGAKVHRSSRRALGRGQHTQLPGADVVFTTTTPVVHMAFSVPVVVRGLLDPGVTGLTPVSQVIVDSQHVNVTMSDATTGLAYNYPAADPLVSTMQGGQETGTAGTF